MWYMFIMPRIPKEVRWIEQTEFAASKDLLHWERCRENPVLQVNQEAWDTRFVLDPYIVKDGETWLDFYFGLGAGHAQEGLALSKDLIHWDKVKEPIQPCNYAEINCGRENPCHVVSAANDM